MASVKVIWQIIKWLYAGNSQEVKVLIMQKSNTQTDNPQKRLCCTLSWIAGMIDSDGCIGVTKRNNAKTEVYLPRITFTSAHEEIFNEMIKAFQFCGFPFFVSTKKSLNPNHSDRMDLRVTGMKRCYRVLRNLIPFLRGKKERGKLLFKFCDSRLTKMIKSQPYTKEQLECCHILQDFNRKGQCRILRDYTPFSKGKLAWMKI